MSTVTPSPAAVPATTAATPVVPVLGISHVALNTADLDRFRRFYEGTLGLRPAMIARMAHPPRNVRRAIAAIGRAVPGLGAHLDASVRTGHACTYAPEPSTLLTWTVTRGDDPGP
jgi:hypothetical protein